MQEALRERDSEARRALSNRAAKQKAGGSATTAADDGSELKPEDKGLGKGNATEYHQDKDASHQPAVYPGQLPEPARQYQEEVRQD